MKSETPKQYLPLSGKTVIEWSLSPFLECDWIAGVVLVLSPADSEFAALPISKHPKLKLVSGGDDRATSVLNGLLKVESLADEAAPCFVLVHDAARPAIELALLDKLRRQASDEHGGLLAMPVADTVKREQDGRVESTLNRSDLWRAQTPQLFRLDLLISAMRQALSDGHRLTDEASAMEYAGYQPRLIRGAETNFKLTYPEHLQMMGRLFDADSGG